jgi:hypothetical protein
LESKRENKRRLLILGRLGNVKAMLHIPLVCPALFGALPT